MGGSGHSFPHRNWEFVSEDRGRTVYQGENGTLV